MLSNHLTEDAVLLFLKDFYQDEEIFCNKVVPNSNMRTRPDFRLESPKIIVEFDGDRHYTQFETIAIDVKKDSVYSELGYSVIRVPYFVQFSNPVIKNLFNIDLQIRNPNIINIQSYSHGFIDEKAVLPWNFCERGVKRFLGDLARFSFIKRDILVSLQDKKCDMPILVQNEMNSLEL